VAQETCCALSFVCDVHRPQYLVRSEQLLLSQVVPWLLQRSVEVVVKVCLRC
jgi:hypothetical protein